MRFRDGVRTQLVYVYATDKFKSFSDIVRRKCLRDYAAYVVFTPPGEQ